MLEREADETILPRDISSVMETRNIGTNNSNSFELGIFIY